MIELRGLELWLRPGAEAPLAWVEQFGLTVKITSIKRSAAEQQRLRSNFERCRAAGLYPSAISLGPRLSCKWPAAPVGSSAHQFGLAWDSIIADPLRRWPQDQLDEFWKRVREYFGWRVPAEDAIHAELPDWQQLIGQTG